MILISLFFILPKNTFAQSSSYVINSFDSKIEVNQDSSLTVTENILANFYTAKHGIIRVIPISYSANNKTVNADLKVLSITNNQNQNYPYKTSRLNQSVKLQIGDANKTITGPAAYIIKYQISGVLLRYDDHDEIYWNGLGHEWDTSINKATVAINSPYAKITNAICYAGAFGSKEKNCSVNFDKQVAWINGTKIFSPGDDLTAVVALDKNNQLTFSASGTKPPSKLTRLIYTFLGYFFSLGPIVFLILVWYFRGRDQRFASDNLYTVPEDQKTRTVKLFEREHLPMVYSPIQGLTPSQIGTIIDEKVDTKDVVAEIVELARLSFMTIKKTEKKGFLHKDIDYVFTKIAKNTAKLNDYQQYLLESLFGKNDETSISKLKNHFYIHLGVFKSKLYKNLVQAKIFANNPQTAKILWGIIYGVLMIIAFTPITFFTALTGNPLLIFLFFSSIIPAIFLIKNMPRRTAWGHSLFRQCTGLKYYVSVGKWREEIAEKNLFLQEILPLAIALGVVDKLAKDMKDLAIEPPSYLNGFTAAYLVSDLNHFSSQTTNALTSSPSGSFSGSSSWSGGSGFSSGGSSGGGFGGGGGGSW